MPADRRMAFCLKWLQNHGAPSLKVVGKRTFFFMILVMYLGMNDFSSGSSFFLPISGFVRDLNLTNEET